MVRFLLQRPVAVIMSTIAFIVLGVVAYFRVARVVVPDIEIPEITVHYTWDNASISEIENTITAGLRNQLQQIPKLTEIQSESREGSRADYHEIRVRYFAGLCLYRSEPKSGCRGEQPPERSTTPDDHQSVDLGLAGILYQHPPENGRIGGKVSRILRVHGCRTQKKVGTTTRYSHGGHQRDVFAGTLYPARRGKIEKPENHPRPAEIGNRQQQPGFGQPDRERRVLPVQHQFRLADHVAGGTGRSVPEYQRAVAANKGRRPNRNTPPGKKEESSTMANASRFVLP